VQGLNVTPARLAVIGLGDAGYTMHLPAAKALANVTLAGVCDPDPVRRGRASSRFAVKGYADPGELLQAEKPDCVVIATPSDSHAALCMQALSHGCNVICEKPFVRSVAEADEVIATARHAGRRIALNHEFREMPIFRATLDAIAGEGRHRIVFFQAWQQVYLPSSGEGGRSSSVRHRVLYEAGIHLVDYAMAVFDAVPEMVTAILSDGGRSNDMDSDSVASLTLTFPGGKLATITMNRLARGENHYFDARVDTESASYRASFGGRARLSAGLHRATRPHVRIEYGVSGLAWKEVGGRRTILATNPANPRMRATRELLSRTVDAFRTGAPLPCSADWARDVLRVIDAAYRSAASGRTEAVGISE
jgi:Predicted dehydrogenases and related proteins